MRKFTVLNYSEWSLKRKLFAYMLLLTVLLLIILAIGLPIIVHTSNTKDSFTDSLEIQMEVFEKDICAHFDHLAASAITLSKEMSVILENELTAQGIRFSELNDNSETIVNIQENMIEPLRNKLLQTDSSGVFVMLNTTANSSIPTASSSKTGLYLQVNGYNPIASEILMYRGIPAVAKKHKITPHRKWRLEFSTDLFPDYAKITGTASLPLEKAFYITNLALLPGTNEQVLLLTVPMLGENGDFLGICGYEISSSYFATYHKQPSKLAHLSCLLATDHENILITSEVLSCSSSDGHFHKLTEDYAVSKKDNGFAVFKDESFSYFGLTKRISLSPKGEKHLLVVMIPKNDYDRAVYAGYAQSAVFVILLLFFTVSFCQFFSKRFLAPLLSALEQIKSDKRAQATSDIPEILDLIEYLNNQEKAHGETLSTLENKHREAEEEKLRLKAEYDRALSDFKKIEEKYTNAKNDLSRVEAKMERLAYSRKNEIDPDDYQYFIAGLQTLTESERNLFEYYLAGKSVKEILSITGIKESTLKYHNHNLLGKLGMSSRKQMLRYAEIMRNNKNTSSGQ
ncbi:MAG: hypothetical protein IJD67_01015 [Clostridia bacterium]|nr:hypothetical protein [Clostridia bacterium]